MRAVWRWAKRLGLAMLLVIVSLLSPVVYVELACRGSAETSPYDALLPPEYHRAEARTLLTYPEWHIVHAYDDYAEVIRTGDPHDFDYLGAIHGYWSSLCALTREASAHGGVDAETRQLVHVIGVSFTAEMALKGLYEETVGRIFTWIRGADRAPLDDLSAEQSGAYAAFLQQVPWYRWDFEGDVAALDESATDLLRDRERRFALGIEYGAKAAYARVIANAVANVGFDELRLRMVVDGLSEAQLSALDGVEVVAERPEGVEIETPRYRELTGLLLQMAQAGGTFVEIAGNDDILLTALSDRATEADALHSFARQGYGDHRHLMLVQVRRLADTLRTLPEQGLRLEHVHDY